MSVGHAEYGHERHNYSCYESSPHHTHQKEILVGTSTEEASSALCHVRTTDVVVIGQGPSVAGPVPVKPVAYTTIPLFPSGDSGIRVVVLQDRHNGVTEEKYHDPTEFTCSSLRRYKLSIYHRVSGWIR